MKARKAWPGARLVDSFPYSVGGTRDQAFALARTGVDALAGYVGVITRQRIDWLHEAGVGFLAVTRAGAFTNGAFDELAWLARVGYPRGADAFLDMEGLTAYHTDPMVLIDELNAWFRPMQSAGFGAGLYLGEPQPLTSTEVQALACTRYWLGIGTPRDRKNELVWPSRGWCILQGYHGEVSGRQDGMFWKDTGVLIDPNMVVADHRKDLPTWAVA